MENFQNTADYFPKRLGVDFNNINIVVARADFKERKRVLLSEIIPMQERIDMKIIENKRKGFMKYSEPFIVKFKSNLYLIDGHHTAVAKILNGQKYIFGMFLSLNS